MWKMELKMIVAMLALVHCHCQTCVKDSCNTDSQVPETGQVKETWSKMKTTDTGGVKDASGATLRLTRRANGKFFTPMGEEAINRVKFIKMRSDDVIIGGYPKTGCHWIWEIVYMLLKGKAEHSRIGKTEYMLEMVPPEVHEALPSPRVLNTHVEYDELPQEALETKTKLILTIRNPKDTAVSLYTHHVTLTSIYGYDGKFSDWFPLYMEGKVDCDSYLDFYLLWDKVIHDHPDHPILVVKFEDLKEDPISGIRRLAEFLGVTLSDDVIKEIAEATEIEAMKKHFENSPVVKPFLKTGSVGGWKHWLTVAQSEWIDESWESQLNTTMMKTRYQLP